MPDLHIVLGHSTRQFNPGGFLETAESHWRDLYKSPVVKTAGHAQRKVDPHKWMNPTYRLIIDSEFQCAMVQFGSGPGTVGHNGIQYPGPSVDFLDDTNLPDRTLHQALQNLKDQKVSFAQAFAERKQTVGLIESSATKIARAIIDLRHGRFASAAGRFGLSASRRQLRKYERQGDKIAQSWLELQYGWKPLLSDVYGAAETLAKNDLRDKQRYIVTAKARKAIKDLTSYPVSETGIHYTGVLRREYGCFVRLDCFVDNPSLGAAAACGLTNPLSLAWELLPWSFVADWFLPVGNYLSDMDAYLGFGWLGGSLSTRQISSFTGGLRRVGWGESSASFPYWYGTGASFHRKRVERTPYASKPIPSFPGFKNPINTAHMLNALALLRGSVR